MTRQEIIDAGAKRLNDVNDRAALARREIEHQRLAALSTIDGVAAILAAYTAALKKADSNRTAAKAAADGAQQQVNQAAQAGRVAATEKAGAARAASRQAAEHLRDSKCAKAEQDYTDAFNAASGTPAHIQQIRQEARAKRDTAVRDAERECDASAATADRQYAADLAAAAAAEVDAVQAAMQKSTDDRQKADTAYEAAVAAAAEARNVALAAHPPAAAVQEAFDLRLANVERDTENDKAAIWAWMKTEIEKLG